MKALLLAGAVLLGGCATVGTLNAKQPDAPVVYAGTRLDLYALKGGCCAEDRFGTAAPAWPGLDLPFSAVLDTLLLPLSVATALGAQFNATGGL